MIRKQGPIRLTELASCIGVGKPSVSRQIAFLERLGLVSKEADPLDGRAQIIRLTPKGEEKMHQVQDARREVFRERLGEWPPEELQTLARYMAKLNATYERDGFPRDEPALAPASSRHAGHAKDPGHRRGPFVAVVGESGLAGSRRAGPWPTRR